MNEKKKGRRQGRRSSVLDDYRAWVAGMNRGERIRHRILLGAVGAAVAIILLWLVFAIGFQPPKLPGVGGEHGSFPGSSATDGWEVEGPGIAQSGRKEGLYTFLIAGLDTSSGATDTMLLLTYDTHEKRILGLNLPRDTIMNVSYNSKRLNTIYKINKGKDAETQVEKGMTALKESAAKLTGITADYYVLLEWEAIGELVDALGGVEFEVPFDMDYDDPYQDLHIHQKAGLRLLSGDDAMQVIRHRKNNDGSHSAGDVGRLSIQQDFLKAVVKKCLQPTTFLKVPALAEIFAENVKTDLSVGNILAFAKTAYGMDPATGVSFQTAPLAADAWYKGAAMVTLDGEGILEIVNNGMNPYLRDIELSDLELIYKKADGSYGVTNGTLADPKMGESKKPAQSPVVEPPVEGENPEVVDPENPDAGEVPGESGVEPTDPDPSQSGEGTEGRQPEQSGEVPAEGTAEEPGEEPADVPQTEPEPPEIFLPGQNAPESPAEEGTQPGTEEEIPEWMIPVTP